jgi:predicted nuclease of restriction endonuclease-like (RecB) superfamily
MTFDQLLSTLTNIHFRLSEQAARQADLMMTARNYLYGFYLVEFEQHGVDRAAYGTQLLLRLSDELRKKGLKGTSDRSLRLFRQFYLTYPQIWQSLIAKSDLSPLLPQIRVTAPESEGVENLPPLDTGLLLSRLSYTHFVELIKVEDPWKRRFYEIEAIKNSWKVRELNRAISTLLFERTGLSTDKKIVISRVKENEPEGLEDIIRSPYLLEFLGLEEKPEYTENDLEGAIISHLQEFLLEMGRGFCFEARQKRISFNNRHYRIDLVFYHRILKCHVLIDLKIGEFDHADAGQMNVYLNYYKANEMSPGDNPPVGIILCAGKDDALVEYATSGLAQEVFVSRYLTQLPAKEQLLAFIRRESTNL